MAFSCESTRRAVSTRRRHSSDFAHCGRACARAWPASSECSAGADEWFGKCRLVRFALRRLGVNGNYITEEWSRLARKLMSILKY